MNRPANRCDYEQADSVLTAALKLFSAHTAPDHPSVIVATDALGQAKMHLGAYAESDSLLAAAYVVRRERLGASHRTVQDVGETGSNRGGKLARQARHSPVLPTS